MGKVLRLGFVMGGGVSLGSFSGAALSESVKQQLMYGQYDTGVRTPQGEAVYAPYERVELDVFCGASAGAISLAIMLRTLINYTEKYAELGFASEAAFVATLRNDVSEQFGARAIEGLAQERPQAYQQLLAAQAVQYVQRHVWSEEVDLQKLLGLSPVKKSLQYEAGLLDRALLEDLAKKYFQFRRFSNRVEQRQLLASRVLFGCTLASLSPTFQSGQLRYPHISDAQRGILKGLNDKMVERVHKELRVFDLHFSAIEPTETLPTHWLPYHLGPIQTRIESGQVLGNLAHNDCWRNIAATTLASGAFPFAFEPVVLTRYAHELGARWPKALKDKTSYPFSYVDGGLFNNEPVLEALRLSNYIDQLPSEEAFERQILFIDPNVTELSTDLQQAVHQPYSVSRSLLTGSARAQKKSSFTRLLSKAPSLLNALLNEAQAVETDRICEVLDRIAQRDNLRDFYKKSLQLPDEGTLKQMIRHARRELLRVARRLQLPASLLSLPQVLVQTLREEPEFYAQYWDWTPSQTTLQAHRFVFAPHPTAVPEAELRGWVYALHCVLLDISMNLIGQQTHAKLIPIAPFDFYSRSAHNAYPLLKLPGYGMGGFLGFVSQEASTYEVDYGRYCAQRILRDLGLLGAQAKALDLPTPFDYTVLDEHVQRDFSEAMLKRIREAIPKSWHTVLPFLESWLKDKLEDFVARHIDSRQQRQTFTIKLKVPNEHFTLRGFTGQHLRQTKLSVEPIQTDNRYYLVTTLDYDIQQKRWFGKHVDALQSLCIDRSLLFEDKEKLRIPLPNIAANPSVLYYPNPTFELDIDAELLSPSHYTLEAPDWDIQLGVQALDQSLWGHDQWFDMAQKL